MSDLNFNSMSFLQIIEKARSSKNIYNESQMQMGTDLSKTDSPFSKSHDSSL